MKVRTMTSRSFILWPANSQEANGLGKKKRQANARVIKLNDQILEPFVGWSVLYKKIGNLDFVYRALAEISNFWKVPRQIEIAAFMISMTAPKTT